jgi:hypothetical protein
MESVPHSMERTMMYLVWARRPNFGGLTIDLRWTYSANSNIFRKNLRGKKRKEKKNNLVS